jgi:hypothetical protein
MGSLDGLEMESNVGRDVLSTANSFGSVAKVIAEYVSNSVDAPENGQAVNIIVTKRRAYGGVRLVIEDDARGMDGDDLRRFFTMHAENEARRRGRTVRGVFGTGKAAAFGIGSSLQVETVRSAQRWVVRLEKTELENAVRERRKPRPTLLSDGTATSEANGTRIIIDGVIKAVHEGHIIKELQRRMGRHLAAHNVVVFNRRAELVEPKSKRTWTFEVKYDPAAAAIIGEDVVATIDAALHGAVEDELRGVIVTANEFPVAQVLASGDQAARLFGHCDVPRLETDRSTPGPYTDARDLILNEENALAGALAGWLRRCLAEASGELAAEERELRRRAQDAALRRAASRMEEVLNRHFQGEFRKARNPIGELGTKVSGVGPDENGELVRPGEGFAGYDIPERESDKSDPVPTGPDVTPTTEDSREDSEHRLRGHDPFGEGRGEATTEEHEPRRRRRSGGFRIDFENATADAARSRYLESELLILVNLEHPELAAAHQDGDTPLFRMLAFEAAAQEYCYATAYVRIEEDGSIDPSDIVEYVRTTMESLTRDVAAVVGDLTTLPLLEVTRVAAIA